MAWNHDMSHCGIECASGGRQLGLCSCDLIAARLSRRIFCRSCSRRPGRGRRQRQHRRCHHRPAFRRQKPPIRAQSTHPRRHSQVSVQPGPQQRALRPPHSRHEGQPSARRGWMRNKRAAVPCFMRLTRCTALQDPQQAEFAGDNYYIVSVQ